MIEDSTILIRAFQVVVYATAPVLLTAMCVGIVVGLLQTVIQVQDQTIGYVIKLAAVACVLLATSGWLMRQLGGLFDLILEAIGAMGPGLP